MSLDIDAEVAALRQMTVHELRQRHERLFDEPSRSRHKEHLVRRIAWRMQALAEGDLSERARRQAAELARDADLRMRQPGRSPQASRRARKAERALRQDQRLPMPGTLLVRHYRGQTVQVQVLEEGFEYDGASYKSLTAVVKQITGKHWNGFHFFGLHKREKQT